MEEEVNISGWLNRRRYTAKREQLDREAPSQRLERIEVHTVPPRPREEKGPFNVTLYWPGKDEEPSVSYPFEGLNEGESVMTKPGTYMKLERRRAGWLWQTWWLLLLILLALLTWIGVFGYLYLRA